MTDGKKEWAPSEVSQEFKAELLEGLKEIEVDRVVLSFSDSENMEDWNVELQPPVGRERVLDLGRRGKRTIRDQARNVLTRILNERIPDWSGGAGGYGEVVLSVSDGRALITLNRLTATEERIVA